MATSDKPESKGTGRPFLTRKQQKEFLKKRQKEFLKWIPQAMKQQKEIFKWISQVACMEAPSEIERIELYLDPGEASVDEILVQ
jgi:hypothetical protein